MISPNSSALLSRPFVFTVYVNIVPFGDGSPPIWPAGLRVFWALIAFFRSMTVRPSAARRSGRTQTLIE